MEVVNERMIAGQVFVNATIRESYSVFHHCIFLGSLKILGTGNHFFYCTFTGSIDCQGTDYGFFIGEPD